MRGPDSKSPNTPPLPSGIVIPGRAANQPPIAARRASRPRRHGPRVAGRIMRWIGLTAALYGGVAAAATLTFNVAVWPWRSPLQTFLFAFPTMLVGLLLAGVCTDSRAVSRGRPIGSDDGDLLDRLYEYERERRRPSHALADDGKPWTPQDGGTKSGESPEGGSGGSATTND